MTKYFRIALVLLLALAFTPPLLARGGFSLEQAVKQARESTGGRVISAETREEDGHVVHNIRILTRDGKVRRMRYDAGEDNRGKRR